MNLEAPKNFFRKTMLLSTLKCIIQDVNAAQDLHEALSVVMSRINKAMDIDASSVFLLDSITGKHVLAGTKGLNKSLVGKLRLKLGEGLVGVAAARAEPVNLKFAASNPRYLHCPGLGEEAFKAFLATPIIHQRHVLGVLVAYRKEERSFDEAEEAFLITLSAQLSGIIAHALATCTIFGADVSEKNTFDQVFSGRSGASGVAIGCACVVYPAADLRAVLEREISEESVQDEIALFKKALVASRREIDSLKQNIRSHGLPKEECALFDVYLHILDGKTLVNEILAEIQARNCAQAALKKVILKHVARFEDIPDPYLKERACDLKDIGQRLLSHLQARTSTRDHFPDHTILVGEEVTPSALAEVPQGKLAGIVSVKGSSNSHVSILALALGIPVVLGVQIPKIAQFEGQEIIVDGYHGQVYCAPSPAARHEFYKLIQEQQAFNKQLEPLRDLPAKTLDSHTITLYVNTGLVPDIERSLEVGAEGIGLYRTEMSFITRECFPSEEEQRLIYRKILESFAHKPVTMRTLDIGGDKVLAYFPIVEDNPYLGWRGIRITLDHPDIFLGQLRAMLQASAGLDNLQIMFPMVSCISEIEDALCLFRQAFQEVSDEGFAIKKPPLGIMVEVPSAVYQAQAFSKRIDFLSVGSNDLIQYLLAADRGNSRVANLYDSLHPAVLRALMQVVAGAHREGKPVSICGEMANDPVCAVLLMAMGFDALSMNATRLPEIKWVIRGFNMQHANTLLEEVLKMDDASDIRNYMEQALEEAGIGSILRAGN